MQILWRHNQEGGATSKLWASYMKEEWAVETTPSSPPLIFHSCLWSFIPGQAELQQKLSAQAQDRKWEAKKTVLHSFIEGRFDMHILPLNNVEAP